MLVTLIVFILVFGVVVVSHELGHFLIAKLNGIKVVEFSVGMGPTLLEFTKGETNYALKLLPLGGACVFEGEDGIYTEEKGNEEEKKNVLEKPEGTFNDANVWSRIATVFAGPFFNIILAFLLSLIVVGFTGATIPKITSLMDGYPAADAGLQVGDVITKIDGERIYLYNEVTFISSMSTGEELEIEYTRGGEKHTTMLTPKYSEEDSRYYIGFTIGENIECKGWNLIKYSACEVRYWLKATVESLLMLVQGKLTGDDLSGPVGIAVAIDDMVEQATPYGIPTVVLTMMNFAVLLSVNLGVMNLLPLPALDGGRLVFMFIEVLRGKPVPPEKEGIVHFIGFVALMILMVFVLYNDITKIFR
ncbi:MAG: RIP metalloprotease RseP [Lachnospiraceae bacterium]|nr:RIP metalloprotease RseP [Lachnospiraceae bacterium]